MKLVKDTPFEVAWQTWMVRPRAPCLTVVVKGTFTVVESGPCPLAPEQEPLTGDLYTDDDPRRSVRYESDFAYVKPEGECLVTGSCHAPWGAPSAAEPAGFRVGSVVKELAVIGDRFVTGPAGRPGEPAPFTAMPLVWERSFGGPRSRVNPVGLGLGPSLVEGRAVLRLPNIESPRELIGSARDRPRPAGAGPIPRTWPARRELAGTYDESWRRLRWPWLSRDFQWTYFNAAPEDQRLQGFFRGDEEVALINLHPTFPRVRCHLPGLRARVFLRRGEGQLTPLTPALDTVVIDADAGTLICLWRAVTEVATEALGELSHLFVVHEELGAQRTAKDYGEWFERGLAEAEAEERAFDAEPIPDLAGGEAVRAAPPQTIARAPSTGASPAVAGATDPGRARALPDPIPLDSPVLAPITGAALGSASAWIGQLVERGAPPEGEPPSLENESGSWDEPASDLGHHLEGSLSFELFLRGLSAEEAEALDPDEPETIMLQADETERPTAPTAGSPRSGEPESWSLPRAVRRELLAGVSFLDEAAATTEEGGTEAAAAAEARTEEGGTEAADWEAGECWEERISDFFGSCDDEQHPTIRFLERISRQADPQPNVAGPNLREPEAEAIWGQKPRGGDTVILRDTSELVPRPGGDRPPERNRRPPPSAGPNLREPLPAANWGGRARGGDTQVLDSPLSQPPSGGDTMVLLNPLDRPSWIPPSLSEDETTTCEREGDLSQDETQWFAGRPPDRAHPEPSAPGERALPAGGEDLIDLAALPDGDDELFDLSDDFIPTSEAKLTAEQKERRGQVLSALARGQGCAGWDLSDLDLTGLDLRGGDFRGALLIRADLRGAKLDRAILDGAVLLEADLSGASLCETSFVEAFLTRARGAGIRFEDARLEGLVAIGARLLGACFTRCRCAGAELAGADLRGAVFEAVTLDGADLSGARLNGAYFRWSSLRDAFFGAGLSAQRVKMADCDLRLIRAFDGANLTDASLAGARIAGGRLPGARLDRADLSAAELDGADLSGASLARARLLGCRMRGVRLDRARLAGATLAGSDLYEARLEGADLRAADLRGCNLYGAELLGAILGEARLEGAILAGTKLAP